MGVEAHLRERIVPIRQAQVHNHQSEVIGEGIRDEKPLARKVLEPDLWLGSLCLVDQGQSPIFDF